MPRCFVISWHFLTAIPLTHSHHDPTPSELANSMAWFPVIGLLLGGLLALCAYLLSEVFSRAVTDALLIIFLVVLTGGLHQDGLADTFDGWAGGRTPEQRLAIMRDGRIGAIGATALILVLGLRYAGLSALPEALRLPVLLCMPAIGRWAMVIGVVWSPYARADGGLAAPFLADLRVRHVLLATVSLAPALFLIIGFAGGLIALALAALAARAVAALAYRLCGGITGDVLGTINEIAEILFLLFAPLLVRLR
jgi:adenosylcobinamide-GDP ribazoletransferase